MIGPTTVIVAITATATWINGLDIKGQSGAAQLAYTGWTHLKNANSSLKYLSECL